MNKHKQSRRFCSIVNLEQFAQDTAPLKVGTLLGPINPIDQMVLRVLVQSPYSKGLQMPTELDWLSTVLEQAKAYQNDVVGIKHPFIYITVRSGKTSTSMDDLWHVDGFSTRYNYLPEANYIFSLGDMPTQYLDQRFEFPEDFDPMVHNVHSYLQNKANPEQIRDLAPDTLYFIDPYVVHRRPPGSFGIHRTFVRISFTPIEITDINNTPNPLIPTAHYVTDGVKDFRDTLKNYESSK